jgi:hypothetical protein
VSVSSVDCVNAPSAPQENPEVGVQDCVAAGAVMPAQKLLSTV